MGRPLRVKAEACISATKQGTWWRRCKPTGHDDVVALLIHHGADVQARKNQALRRAVHNRHDAVIDLLIKSGADLAALWMDPETNEGQRFCLITKYAAHATGGYEAVMLLDGLSRVKALRCLHRDISVADIQGKVDMMDALSITPKQMAETWMGLHPAPTSLSVTCNLAQS